MKRTTRIALGIGTALSLALASAFVSAHPYGYGPGHGMGPMAGMGYGPGHGMGPMAGTGYGPAGRGMGPQGFADPAATVESRLSSLKSALKITTAQEAAWQAYAEKAKQHATAMQAWRATMQGSARATLPERLEARTAMMAQRDEQMKARTAAVKDLYAVLTPEQKAIADQRLGGFGPMAGGGFRGGPGGRWH